MEIKKTFFTCGHATALAWCRKRQYFCKYFAGRACDDYIEGEPSVAYEEMIANKIKNQKEQQKEQKEGEK